MRPGSEVTIYRWHITYNGHLDLSLTTILKDSNYFLKLSLREFQHLPHQTTKTMKLSAFPFLLWLLGSSDLNLLFHNSNFTSSKLCLTGHF